MGKTIHWQVMSRQWHPRRFRKPGWDNRDPEAGVVAAAGVEGVDSLMDVSPMPETRVAVGIVPEDLEPEAQAGLEVGCLERGCPLYYASRLHWSLFLPLRRRGLVARRKSILELAEPSTAPLPAGPSGPSRRSGTVVIGALSPEPLAVAVKLTAALSLIVQRAV
jgi:hypothetical protein